MINDHTFPPATCHSCRNSSCRLEWHEYDDNNRPIVVWHCPDCGREFETVEDGDARQISTHELVRTFLPNLVVG